MTMADHTVKKRQGLKQTIVAERKKDHFKPGDICGIHSKYLLARMMMAHREV